MRILVISQYFWPENFRINEVASHFHKNGNKVKVLTTNPSYPNKDIFNDFYKKDMLETFSSVSNRVYISKIASFDTDNYFCCTNHELILNNFEGIPKDLIANRPVISKSGIVGQAYDVINDSIKVIF